MKHAAVALEFVGLAAILVGTALVSGPLFLIVLGALTVVAALVLERSASAEQ